MHLGRVFRRMGLPPWTFLGIGVSGVLVTYLAQLVEVTTRDLLVRAGANPLQKVYLPPLAVLVTVLILVCLLALVLHARYGLDRMRLGGKRLPSPGGKRALILLVSNPESALFAIRYHLDKGTLEHVWLIPSNELDSGQFGPGTRALAEAIEARCREEPGWAPDGDPAAEGHPPGARRKEPRTIEIHRAGVSPADAQDAFDVVNRCFRDRRFMPREIIADFTGGTKPMSVGMIMACLPQDRELEYVAFNPASRTSSGPFLIDYQHSAFNLIG